MIYLDNNATTPIDPEVGAALHASFRIFGNPSSSHDIGLMARESVEKARTDVARLLGAAPDEIVFTSGGTESNNLALCGLAYQRGRGHIVTSVIEHPSVTNPCRHLEDRGFDVSYVGVTREGMVSVDEILGALKKETFLISIMHANNETGVIQPVAEIGSLAMERGIVFHTDAAQTVGKIPVSALTINADLVTIVSHKFYGPKGVGALYVRRGVVLKPVLYGAGHERGLRPGTENVQGILALGKACELAHAQIQARVAHTQRVTDLLYDGLKEAIRGVVINGSLIQRLPNTLNILIPGIDSTELLSAIKGTVAASSGSACHAGERSPSPVLKAMGLSDRDALSSIRLSTGKDTTEDEIRRAVEVIATAVSSISGSVT